MKLNGSIKWVIALFITAIIGVGGWYSYAVQHFADEQHLLFSEEIHQLNIEDDDQNQIIIANTGTISDIKTEITDRLARIEATLVQIEKRIK